MQEQFFLGRSKEFSEWNRYEVIGFLGSGATSKVYQIRSREDGKNYAMKVCEDKKLLQQESDMLKRLKHPVLPAWQDYFEEEQGFLIMEYIEGITLQKYVEKSGKLPVMQARGILLELLDVLGYLHRQSPIIVYRDLKPANVLIEKDGRIRLIDIGGAAVSKYKVGTYGYAAPEQFWEGVETTPACDLYAAGKILAFLLTGKDPCQPPYDMLQFCRRDRTITAEMYRVLQRSMASESLGRYGSAEEFERAFKAACCPSWRKKWVFSPKRGQIVYEKCIWKSEYQRIF